MTFFLEVSNFYAVSKEPTSYLAVAQAIELLTVP